MSYQCIGMITPHEKSSFEQEIQWDPMIRIVKISRGKNQIAAQLTRTIEDR